MRRHCAAALAALVTTLVALPRAEAACAGRPTDPGGVQGYSYDTAEVRSYATANVRVHWATSGLHAPALDSSRPDGVPTNVATAADAAEEALSRYAQMGYHAIPSDAACPSNGGDGKIDIYLLHFTAADGSTIAECTGAVCSSFAIVEAAFQGRGYASAEEGFRTVVTHELFHAVQNTYKTNDDSFWAEGSAQWAMHVVHPELPDFVRQLTGFFKDTTRSIDAAPTGVTAAFLYGSAVWPLFLAQRHGEGIIREIYEAESKGQTALGAADAVLQTKGRSLADAYPSFAAWNAATGKLAGVGGYPDAAKYPGVAIDALADGVANITSGLSSYAYRGTLDARTRVALETDEARNAGVLVPVQDGKPDLGRAQRLPVETEGDVLVVVSGTTTKKTDAPFTVRLLAPSAAGVAPVEHGCSATGSSPDASPAAILLVVAAVLRRRRAS
jgi:uncharacterized protein (TIGR03382 family)